MRGRAGVNATWLLSLGVLVSCVSPKPGPAERPLTSAIIFVPGYYGSSLKIKQTGERFFITAGRFLFGSPSVSLYTRELATPPAPDLVVDRVMDRVDVLGGLLGRNVYGEFTTYLSKLATARHAKFVPFAYDWRRDLTDTARDLAATVEALRADGVTDVQIVAHSMGCLVTTYYLGYGAQSPETANLDWSGAARVSSVVLMAGPYRGAFSLFRNMQTGAKIGSNTSYLPAETVASLPASYQLLPMLDFHLIDRDRRTVPFEVSDVSNWDGLRLGLLKSNAVPAATRARRREFTAGQLTRAKQLAGLLDFKSGEAPPRLRVLQLKGHGIPVVDTAVYESATGRFAFDTDPEFDAVPAAQSVVKSLFTDGDGSVTVRSAELPAAFRKHARVMTTTRPHDLVFDDEAFRRALSAFLSYREN